MPRYVVESEEEQDAKTGRRTRAAVTAATDSPMRRSTRIRQGSVNPDGSSPESITGTQAPRITRRRVAAAASGETLTVPDQAPRVLRSRKTSVSSNVDSIDLDSAPVTPRARGNKRLSVVECSPCTPKPAAKTKRTARAASETKSPAPVVRITRRTRATSIDPEPAISKVAAALTQSTTVSTPNRKRRTLVSVLPTEPVLNEEEDSEDKNEDSDVEEIVELSDNKDDPTWSTNTRSPSPHKSSSAKGKKSSRKNSLKEQSIPKIVADGSYAEDLSEDSSVEEEIFSPNSKSGSKKSSRKKSSKEQSDAKIEVNGSFAEKLSEDSSVAEEISPKSKSGSKKAAEPEVVKTAHKNQTEESTETDNNSKEQISPKVVQSSATKAAKRHSSDRSKELGMKIEDLLNKSTDEQEKSPGNKENEKLNVLSPDKIRKNLEFTVSHVNIVRGKSIGSSKLSNKSPDKKLNSSLDEQVLSNQRSVYVAMRPLEEEIKMLNSSPDKKSQTALTSIFSTPKENQHKADQSLEDQGDRSKPKTSYTKVDEMIVENEVIEEFSLLDSDDSSDEAKNNFRLSVDEDIEIDKQDSSSKIDRKESNKDKDIFIADTDPESDGHIFDSKRPKDVSRKSESADKKETETGEKAEVPEVENKSDDRQIQEDVDKEESMDTNEHEETKADKSSGKLSPERKSLDKSDNKKSTTETSNQVSDSDSNIGADDLFQNISAEEWNEKNSQKKKQSKEKASPKSSSKPLKIEKEASNSDSDNTVILQSNDSDEDKKKKRKSSVKTIAEEEVADVDTEVDETTEQNESSKLNKSVQSKDQETKKRKSSTKSKDKSMEVDDDVIDDATAISTEEMNSTKEIIEEEKESESTKNTPKNKKNKSPTKSASKSNKSFEVHNFSNSSEGEKNSDVDDEKEEKEDEENDFNSKEKSLSKSRPQLNRNQSTIAVVDSESGQEDVTDPDCPSDNSRQGLPEYLFNVESSEEEEKVSDEEEEDEVSDEEEDKTRNTIDSDIAREMNLAGDDDIQYSDDDVTAEDIRESESEHSDENDAGSDVADFIVPDDEVESSQSSDEEEQQVPRFKRILRKSSSSEEDEKEILKVDERKDSAVKKTKDMLKRDSKTPNNTLSESLVEDLDDEEEESPELKQKSLNFSTNSEKSLSVKKSKKENVVQDLGDTEISISPRVANVETSQKKLKKFNKPLSSLLDSTIDLCTPEMSTQSRTGDKTVSKSPDFNSSLSKKSLKKLRKSLNADLITLTPDNASAGIQTEEEEELLATPKEVKVANKEKKTPKSGKKNQRDSLQLIAESSLVKSSVSDLNKSMTTPNSETPETKFLKKQRLNESLPLLELKKRASKIFDKTELSKMNEDELEEENEISETQENQKEIADDSDDEQNEEDNEAEENGEEINSNGNQDEAEEEEEEEEDDERDEDENNDEESVDEDEEKEMEDDNEEAEESSDEEIVVKTKQSSSLRKSLSKSGEEENGAAITPSKKQKRASTNGVLNGEEIEPKTLIDKPNSSLNESTSRKKRARFELESSETPKGLKQTKKMKISSKNSPVEDKESDSDGAPESLGFSEARDDALQAMKVVADSVKAGKEAKKKKRRDQLEKIRQEKEVKADKKTNLKRLPDDVLENISDVFERPKKKRKLLKKETPQILPSRYMFSPGKSTNTWEIAENCNAPLSSGIGTTDFNVINLEKEKKQPKKANDVASFRERMLARNPRQPVSAFLMYQAKKKASGKGGLPHRKQS